MNVDQITNPSRSSWFESSARSRIAGLLDEGSFSELIGPQERVLSPHLKLFNLTAEFDDGLIIGLGKLDGTDVYLAAQEGRFIGVSFGEVHGAKLVGLLRTACDQASKEGPRAVLLALDTGGVWLQEANLRELAISEVINAILEARIAGVNVMPLSVAVPALSVAVGSPRPAALAWRSRSKGVSTSAVRRSSRTTRVWKSSTLKTVLWCGG